MPMPTQFSTLKENVKKQEGSEMSNDNVIPSTLAVVGTKQLSENNEKFYFDGIVGGLRKIRNRALKIDVLINDLLDCESQGFAVNTVFEPLKYQQEELKNFENVVFAEMQKIIIMCDDKANEFK